ncbi:amidohydrolase [Vibrio mediterranei]|uniref:amidohydrolase n=1 Tax=Vibrio mediterranei TaxID=689 RepID=UPI001EFE699D|nr:amidohydrolase [Vibrio mediterranei]MCG9662755.1 amidohydrolase [Vibrio mediterranei]
MKNTYALLTVFGFTISSFANATSSADTLLINAKIYGYDDATAIAIQDGKIQSIGDLLHIKSYQDKHTEIIDLKEAYVLPGFIDNHNHVFEAASEAGGNCALGLDATLEQQIPYLKACARYSSDNSWLIGYGFSLEAILNDDNENSPLQVLDEIFPNRPVILMEQTSHSMWVNSVALELAAISDNTPDPQGGKILKDQQSEELNGILLDNAGDIVMELAWNSMNNQFDQSYDGLMVGLEQAAAHGITTIGDGRLYWKRGWFDVWKEAERNGDLTARVSLRPWIYPTDTMKSQLGYLKKIHTSDSSQRLIVDQVKMYSDGIFINGTAKTLAPYLDTYVPDQPYGLNYIPPVDMEKWLTALDAIGYSAHIHAIGDGAIRESLNAIAKVRRHGSTKPYTLTHVELIDNDDIPRFAELNATADFQVGSDYVANNDHQWAQAFLGARRAHALMNLRAIFTSGANLTLSSDWNVHDINPLVGIANSIHMGSKGLPNVSTAIDAYSINAAKSLGISDITGSISVGKSADFVVLDRDITKVAVEDIPSAKFMMTMLQGEIVYSQP